MRCLAFTELADDPSTVRRLKGFYDTLDTATTPTTVLLPWIPSPSAVRRLIATKRIYDIVSGTLDERVQKGIVRDDTPQMLIDAGDERLVIVGVSFSHPSPPALPLSSCTSEHPHTYIRSHRPPALAFYLSEYVHVADHRCIQFIMGLLVAGARSTGTTGAFHLLPLFVLRVLGDCVGCS